MVVNAVGKLISIQHYDPVNSGLRLFSVGGFISLFPILAHYLKYHEIIDETTSTMQDFNFGVSYVFIAFNCKTHNSLETMYM